jgi:hypothetical protein
MRRSGLAGLALMAASMPAALLDSRLFFGGWLAAWWWCLGVVLGMFVNGWMHRLTGGEWGEALRPAALLLSRRLPWLLLLFVPLLPGLPRLAEHGVPGFAHAWMALPWLATRLALYALAWWWLTRPASLHARGRAALSLGLHGVLTSLAAVDLLMALMPGWASDGFPLIVLSGQALAATALGVWLNTRGHGSRVPGAATRRDLGNLLLMWTLIWAYVAFMEFLVIWSENLPRETAWYLPRMNLQAVALLLAEGLLPGLALLWRRVKDDARLLARVAVISLVGSVLNAGWWVLPSIVPDALPAGWALFALQTTGMAMLVFGGLFDQLREPEARSLRHAVR